ncbi:MAG: hypothetical protein L6R38_003911 [Xanthoria sp. 2 TBL-2021]|nr:MAG: hypothetical protein L6R38_003911 [Xanthoria sp. 2 TBL-2021]
MSAHGLGNHSVFPFLRLSGEVRNQIYGDIIGPKLPRPFSVYCEQKREYKSVGDFWPDRKFNTAFFFLNRQINREFSDILWNILVVEWKNDHFELDKHDVVRFVSMKRLQRCKLILELRQNWRPSQISRPISYYYTRHPITAMTMEVELTVFRLAHKLNQMPHLREVHLEYNESDGAFHRDFFLRYRDGSLIRWSGDDLKTVFSDDLRGMKKVQMSGTLCSECATLLASAMERPKEFLSDLHAKEPDRCISRNTLPQWSDKHRGWI